MSFKISDICEINGYNLSTKHNLDFINYLDTANLNEGSIEEIQYLGVNKDKVPSRAKRIIRENDILISTVRPNQKHYGIIKDLAENLVASTGFAVLTADSQKVHPEYLYNFLIQDHITTYLNNVAETSTSTYPSIKPSVIAELEIELPLLDEQKEIANILSTLDGKIEVNKRINKTLEKMAQEIFKRWFVDFEFPNEDGDPYKSSGGDLVESELELIPKGWEVKTLAEISSEIITGKTPSTNDKSNFEGNIPFVKIPDMHGNVFITKTESTLSEKGALKNKILPANSIMVSCIATPGLVSISTEPCQTNQQINSIICKESKMVYYIYFTINNLSDYIKTLGSSGSTTLNLNKGQFSKIKVIIASEMQVNMYHNIVHPLFKGIFTNMLVNENLVKMRDLLLPKLMSGEIRVPMEES